MTIVPLAPARSSLAVETEAMPRLRRRYEWWALIPFVLVHLGVAGVVYTGITRASVLCCVVLYGLRMWGVSAGYHRYFSHRTFKTSRVTQFFLAVLAQTSAQKGVLWWAAHHRTHHKYADRPGDMHSPIREGFWYAHVGWIYNHTSETDFNKVRDWMKYPELRFLNRFWMLPPLCLAVACWLFLGMSGLCIGFCLSTVLLWHGTFCINSLAHLIGRRRYATPDDSRNSWILAIITLGEGWHNNHHHHMHSARQGFFWWEIDVTYYVLKMLSWVGLVWDLREPPRRVLEIS